MAALCNIRFPSQDKPTTSTALFSPCCVWEGKGGNEFAIQVMTHFGAFLLGATLVPPCSQVVMGMGLEGSSCACTRFVLSALVPWLIHCSPVKEPSLGNVDDALCLVAWHIIENSACTHLSYRHKALVMQRFGSEKWHNS